MTEAAERLLVTGGSGFVGRRLLARVAQRLPDWTVIAPGSEGSGVAMVELRSAAAVQAMVTEAAPTRVAHLAAIAAVTAAGANPREAWEVNLWGTLNLVEALKAAAPAASLLHVSTGEVYGASLSGGAPADEGALLQPLNPYAASKAAADILVRQAAAQGLHACVVRPFNHIGPGQSEAFALPAFAAQIARMEAGEVEPVLSVGSLDDTRDFLTVDDVVEAYVDLLTALPSATRGEVFNVASGVSVSIREMLDRLLALTSLEVAVKVDPARLRGAATHVRACADKLRRVTGWSPRGHLNDALRAILDYERGRVASR